MRACIFSAALVVLCVAACGSSPPDPRFATPGKTVETLLASYGLEHTPEDEIRRRLGAHEPFRLRNPDQYRACFEDFDDRDGEALGGFVVGAVAAGKDHVRVTIIGDTANVFPTPNVRIVMHRTGVGWKISLRESVPANVRTQLQEIAKRARDQARSR